MIVTDATLAPFDVYTSKSVIDGTSFAHSLECVIAITRILFQVTTFCTNMVTLSIMYSTTSRRYTSIIISWTTTLVTLIMTEKASHGLMELCRSYWLFLQ